MRPIDASLELCRFLQSGASSVAPPGSLRDRCLTVPKWTPIVHLLDGRPAAADLSTQSDGRTT
jgi:hypothetical protein